jgi:hypothetical protein
MMASLEFPVFSVQDVMPAYMLEDDEGDSEDGGVYVYVCVRVCLYVFVCV